MHLRAITYNIHKGRSSIRRRTTIDAIRSALVSQTPDLVFLQEVRGALARSGSSTLESHFERLADSMWQYAAYGKNAVYTSGHHGNVVLSKYQIVEHENFDISTNRTERRGALHAVIALPMSKKRLHAICVHLGLTTRGRRKQFEWLVDRIRSAVPFDEPILLAGDFNDWRLQATELFRAELGLEEVHVAHHGRHARTFPSQLPVLKLDRMYVRGMRVKSATALTSAAWRRLSDHTPLISELTVGPS